MNTVPLWVLILSSLGLPTIICSGFVVVSKFLDTRAARQQTEAAADRADSQRDADAETATRATLEAHIRWDYMILGQVQMFQGQINELRRGAGLPEILYPPIPDPPQLFRGPAGSSSAS